MPFITRGGRPGLLGMAARTAVVAGTATAVSGAVGRHQQRRANEEQQRMAAQTPPAATPLPPAPVPPAPAAGAADDLIEKLQQLGALHGQGLLTDDEFTLAKQRLLGA